MSYIPDYRHETDKLNDVDKAFINGYREAMEDAIAFFSNLDVYDATEEEENALSKAEVYMKDWMEMSETEIVCSLIENADYLPDDIELTDANCPIYKKIKK